MVIFNQLAQLMADLQKLPGGPGLVKEQGAKQKRKERIPVSIVKDCKTKKKTIFCILLKLCHIFIGVPPPKQDLNVEMFIYINF